MSGLQQDAGLNQRASSHRVQCLWMEAGVVDYKLCDRSYDCEHCPFDEAVQSRSAKLIVAADLFAGNERNDIEKVGGCEIASHLFFHHGHTWARVEDQGVIRTGLDDFGQRLLGRAYSLLLPAPDTTVSQGSAGGLVTHQSGVVALPAPVSGHVKETNFNLRQRPELINHDSYDEGWILLIEPSDLKCSLEGLMYGAQATQWLQTEIEKLTLLIDEAINGERQINTLQDGGSLVREFMSGLKVAQRRRIISSFFPLSSNEETGKKRQIISSSGR